MKRFLISLFVWLIWLVSFWFCDDELMYLDNVFSLDFQWYVYDTYYQNNDVDMLCLKNKTCQGTQLTYSANHTQTWYWHEQWNIWWLWFCTTEWIIYYSLIDEDCSMTINWYNFHKLSSNECQLEYNLIPISSVDTTYCVSNWFCPSQDFSWFSNLYVNDILFMPSSIYSLNIPEEFNFDYTWNENLLEIDVKWYNTDSDYIAWIISIQGNRPNNEFFNSIITDLIPKFVPGLVIILFIYFAFRFIKKVF